MLQTKHSWKTEDLRIKVDGPIDLPRRTYEDALKVGSELPKILKSFNNTLTVELLPVYILDKNIDAKFQEVDELLLEKLSSALKNAKTIRHSLSELCESEISTLIPNLKSQCSGFKDKFDKCIEKFRYVVQNAIPKLRNGSESSEMIEKTLRVMEEQTSVAARFLEFKRLETRNLNTTIPELEKEGFANFLKNPVDEESLVSRKTKFVLNFSGDGIDDVSHFLEEPLLESKCQDNRFNK